RIARRRSGDCFAAEVTRVQLPLLTTAVEQQYLVVPVKLEIPVRVRGKPVVVAAVEDDCVVVADATLRQQLLELLFVDEVAPNWILQILLPIQLDRASDVTTVVCSGVFVDLDKDDVLVAGMLGDPITVDEYFLPAHVVSSPGVFVARQPRVRIRRPYEGRDEASSIASPTGQTRDDKECASTFAEAEKRTSPPGNDL